MPLSTNLFRLESSILTRAKRAANRNNVATERFVPKLFCTVTPLRYRIYPLGTKNINSKHIYIELDLKNHYDYQIKQFLTIKDCAPSSFNGHLSIIKNNCVGKNLDDIALYCFGNDRYMLES